MRQRSKICYVETQSQYGYMCHVAPPLESTKFKFELANEVAVLESAKFELSNKKELRHYHYFFPTITPKR